MSKSVMKRLTIQQREPVERAAITVWILANVQDNGDNTWTAIAELGGRSIGPVTGRSREEALSLVSDAASVNVADLTPRLSGPRQ